jgi:NAD-dependent dihydropyrimidine dehydrogenase PreA subunit
METFRYFPQVTTLQLNRDLCVGCGICTQVCPHTVFEMVDGRAAVVDRDGCMECGACTLNCPVAAIAVDPGVGCAAAIINSWIGRVFPNRRRQSACC